MNALVLSMLLAADPGAAALVPDVGLPCQRAAIVEFFRLVSSGRATIADVRRLSDFDHDHEAEAELQRCLLFPKEMEALLCTTGGANKCTFDVHYSPEQEAARPDDNVLPAAQEDVVFERSERRAKGTESELAAFLLWRWPGAFSRPVQPAAISGPWKDPEYPRGITYRVSTAAGQVVLGFNRDECELQGMTLPDGTHPTVELDCLWRQKTGRKSGTSSPPAPAANTAGAAALILDGRWRVYATKPGRVTAMTLAEAGELVGLTMSLDGTAVRLGNALCDRSSYSARDVDADDYFIKTFNVPKGYLDVKEQSLTILSSEACPPPLDGIVVFSPKRSDCFRRGSCCFSISNRRAMRHSALMVPLPRLAPAGCQLAI